MKYGKKVIAEFKFKDYTVLVLRDGDYYNIHLIDPKYQDDELNTLRLQEPVEAVKSDDYFTKERMIEYLSEHILWDFFYPIGIGSFSVSCEMDYHKE